MCVEAEEGGGVGGGGGAQLPPSPSQDRFESAIAAHFCMFCGNLSHAGEVSRVKCGVLFAVIVGIKWSRWKLQSSRVDPLTLVSDDFKRGDGTI